MSRRLYRAPRPVGLVAICVAVAMCGCANPNTPTAPPPPSEPAAVQVVCPQPVTIGSLLGNPTVAVYGQATGTSGAPPVTVSCTPASGEAFPIGSNVVICQATDARQRTASCSFTVTVTAPPRIMVTRFVAFGDSMTA